MTCSFPNQEKENNIYKHGQQTPNTTTLPASSRLRTITLQNRITPTSAKEVGKPAAAKEAGGGAGVRGEEPNLHDAPPSSSTGGLTTASLIRPVVVPTVWFRNLPSVGLKSQWLWVGRTHIIVVIAACVRPSSRTTRGDVEIAGSILDPIIFARICVVPDVACPPRRWRRRDGDDGTSHIRAERRCCGCYS